MILLCFYTHRYWSRGHIPCERQCACCGEDQGLVRQDGRLAPGGGGGRDGRRRLPQTLPPRTARLCHTREHDQSICPHSGR